MTPTARGLQTFSSPVPVDAQRGTRLDFYIWTFTVVLTLIAIAKCDLIWITHESFYFFIFLSLSLSMFSLHLSVKRQKINLATILITYEFVQSFLKQKYKTFSDFSDWPVYSILTLTIQLWLKRRSSKSLKVVFECVDM